jgi:hypothetical protein
VLLLLPLPAAVRGVQGESNPASWMFEVLMASSTTNKDNSQLDLPSLYNSSSQAQVRMFMQLSAVKQSPP